MAVPLLVACDVLIIGVALCIFALFHHVLPRVYSVEGVTAAITPSAGTVRSASAATLNADQDGTSAIDVPQAGDVSSDDTISPEVGAPTTVADATTVDDQSQDLGGGNFADKFTDGEVISTANSYVSENVNVTLTRVQENGVTYYLEDIYIRNIVNLRTAFAQNVYGRSITDFVSDMAEENDAIAAINGDYYGTGSNGVVIRNGVFYRSNVDGDVCVLFHDGTMKVYSATEFDADEVMAAGAYQAWSFGPSLLSNDGRALTRFQSRVSGLNPRTAIGYFEPGHYVFVVVDGRQTGYSNGMTMAQLSALFDELGCKVAYNLDGGKTSVMTFGDSLANQPTLGGRKSSDIIYIRE